jgi:hypothetical protein
VVVGGHLSCSHQIFSAMITKNLHPGHVITNNLENL